MLYQHEWENVLSVVNNEAICELAPAVCELIILSAQKNIYTSASGKLAEIIITTFRIIVDNNYFEINLRRSSFMLILVWLNFA